MNFYEKYLASDKWKHKRLVRLKIDNFKCRTCHNTENLEVHHITYERLGNEDVKEDLITLCRDCHEAITSVVRQRRYIKNKSIKFDSEKERKINYVETSYGEVDWTSSFNNAQRTVVRPIERGSESPKENLWETVEDRSRLRRNGTA